MTTMPSSTVSLLDTDVFSMIYKGRKAAEPYLNRLWGCIPAICFVTVGELYQWAYLKHWSHQSIASLETRLHQYLILPYDESVSRQWAKIQTAKPGRCYPHNDCWIAACAITYGCELLTHNGKDFLNIPGLTVISYPTV